VEKAAFHSSLQRNTSHCAFRELLPRQTWGCIRR
jgi:hypothetical protein